MTAKTSTAATADVTLAALVLTAVLLLPTGCSLLRPSGSTAPARRAPNAQAAPPAPAAQAVGAAPAGASPASSAAPADGGTGAADSGGPGRAGGLPGGEPPSLSSAPAFPPEEGRLAHAPLRPEPPVLSAAEARRQLPSVVPPGLLALSSDGRPLLQLTDLDRNGEPEGFALAVSREAGSADTGPLSDYARLFAEGTPAPAYHLLVLGSRKGRLFLARTVPLGAWQVFEQFRVFPLAPSRPAPAAVSVSFQTPEGSEEKLLLFQEPGAPPTCTLDLKRTLTTQHRLRDIDQDGVLDLLVQERGMEEGTAYETFLTWYRWNGRCLVEQRTLNVVRNLNAFLQQVREALIAADYPGLLRWALDPRQVRNLEARGLDPQSIVFRLMGLLPPAAEGEEEGLGQRGAVQEIVFPQILENPFTTEDERGARFRLSFRWVSTDGLPLVSEMTLYLLAYPFGDRQFMIRSD